MTLSKRQYKTELRFGTGGIRAIMGPRPNQINEKTIAIITQALANILNKRYSNQVVRVSIGYDSRKNSYYYAKICQKVLSSNGIETLLFPELVPTPILVYSIQKFKCQAGIMITASHNSKEYNGYKVYGETGVQLTPDLAYAVQSEIEKLDYSMVNEEENSNLNHLLNMEIMEDFYTEIEKKLDYVEKEKPIRIAFSALHGTSSKAALNILNRNGFKDVFMEPQQCIPDEKFSTCPTPNPEDPEAMEYVIRFGKTVNADVVYATDPDGDRLGIGIWNGNNYSLLTGNEIGLLMLDYLLSTRNYNENAKVFKTIVTSDLLDDIVHESGYEVISVLNGFKYIGDQVDILEQNGEEDNFILGVEENYGYLVGTYIKDKDSIGALLLFSNLLQFYKNKGISVLDRLKYIYNKHGYREQKVVSYTFEDEDGENKIKEYMNWFRLISPNKFWVEKTDYLDGIHGLPKENIIKFSSVTKDSILIRPSGTEPKLKLYFSLCSRSLEELISKMRPLDELITLLFSKEE